MKLCFFWIYLSLVLVTGDNSSKPGPQIVEAMHAIPSTEKCPLRQGRASQMTSLSGLQGSISP